MSKSDELSVFSEMSSLVNYLNENDGKLITPLPFVNNKIADNESKNSSENSHGSKSSHGSNDTFEHIKSPKISNKVYIDVAVVCEEYNEINLMCEDHVINLDEIPITMEMFQIMFYPYKDNFGLNKDFFINNPNLLPFISFLSNNRTVNGKKFYLLEEIIGNIENDLCVLRNCFTKETLVELTNEITSIKTMLDIKCCSVLSSLSWANVIDIIKNYMDIRENAIPVLVVNIVFKTPTQGVKDTIIRFQYKICNTK